MVLSFRVVSYPHEGVRPCAFASTTPGGLLGGSVLPVVALVLLDGRFDCGWALRSLVLAYMDAYERGMEPQPIPFEHYNCIVLPGSPRSRHTWRARDSRRARCLCKVETWDRFLAGGNRHDIGSVLFSHVRISACRGSPLSRGYTDGLPLRCRWAGLHCKMALAL